MCDSCVTIGLIEFSIGQVRNGVCLTVRNGGKNNYDESA